MVHNPLDFNHDGDVSMMEVYYAMGDYPGDDEEQNTPVANGKPAKPRTQMAPKNKNQLAGVLIGLALVFLLVAMVGALGNSNAEANKTTQTQAVASSATTKPSTSVNTEKLEAQRQAAAAREEAEMATKLPFEGMDANKLIDKTALGPHDEVKDSQKRMKVAKTSYYETVPTKTYTWYSKNGKNESLFIVEATLDGKVISVRKDHSTSNYWSSNQVAPDPYATGDIVYAAGTGKKRISSATKPDPADYDDPEDYVDDLHAWQKSSGNTSTKYEDPYDDWELNH